MLTSGLFVPDVSENKAHTTAYKSSCLYATCFVFILLSNYFESKRNSYYFMVKLNNRIRKKLDEKNTSIIEELRSLAQEVENNLKLYRDPHC